MTVGNTVVYNKHDYITRLRNRINKPVCWEEVLNVQYSDVRTIVKGAMTTEPSVQTGTRGTSYTYQTFVMQQDTLTISNYRVLPVFIDEADRYQQSYSDQMEIADFQGKKIKEYIEAQMLAQHASWTDFGATDLSNTGDDDTTAITVSASNIDDIIRAIKRKLYANNGVDFAMEKGIFIIWRPGDYEFLEAFVQANGFSEADVALKNGIPVGMRYMGVEHYLSTQHTAGHLFAGIKKIGDLGILRGTYGKAKFIEDPNATSGLGIISRVDYGWEFCGTSSYYKEFLIDVNVA
jgi:hypothetical protein